MNKRILFLILMIVPSSEVFCQAPRYSIDLSKVLPSQFEDVKNLNDFKSIRNNVLYLDYQLSDDGIPKVSMIKFNGEKKSGFLIHGFFEIKGKTKTLLKGLNILPMIDAKPETYLSFKVLENSRDEIGSLIHKSSINYLDRGFIVAETIEESSAQIMWKALTSEEQSLAVEVEINVNLIHPQNCSFFEVDLCEIYHELIKDDEVATYSDELEIKNKVKKIIENKVTHFLYHNLNLCGSKNEELEENIIDQVFIRLVDPNKDIFRQAIEIQNTRIQKNESHWSTEEFSMHENKISELKEPECGKFVFGTFPLRDTSFVINLRLVLDELFKLDHTGKHFKLIKLD